MSSPAIACPKVAIRSPWPMRVTNSEISYRSSATDELYFSARLLIATASAVTFNLKERGGRRIPAVVMDELRSAQFCANISLVRLWRRSGYRQRELLPL